MRVLSGERFVCVGPAGGGYGDPLARDPARVADDLLDGLVSVAVARDDYGVVFADETGTVDDVATTNLRRTMLGVRNA